MKTIVDDKPASSSGISAAPSSFQMAATSEAFKVLSDGLYPNKIKAVLRELGTNGTDGTVQKYRNLHPDAVIDNTLISNLRPFQVHLPTRFNPYFHLRDYGVGLGYSVVPHNGQTADISNVLFTGSKAECDKFITEMEPEEVKARNIGVIDDVITMYATYFYSNKCQSNDYTGCLGLGSKSPFAYTDSFSVTVWQSGIKRVYNAVISNGYPTIVSVDEPTVSNEPSGMMVKFATKISDIGAFRNEAEKLYPYFVLKPEIIGNTEVVIKPLEYAIKGEGWGVRERDHSGPRAIMGSIAYPIEVSHLRDSSDNAARILRCDIDIYFDIGSLQITPSRESLSYEKTTNVNIQSKCDLIIKDMVKNVDASFVNCKTMWEARCLARNYFYGQGGSLSQLTQIVSVGKITWQGKQLGSAEIVLRTHKGMAVDGIEIYEFWKARKRGSWNNHESIVKKKKSPESFAPDNNIQFVEMDLPQGSFTRCEHALRTKKYEKIIAVRFETKQGKADFLKLTGMVGTEFVVSSSLERPPKADSGSRYSNTSQVFQHTGRTNAYRQHEFWEDTEIDLRDGGIYVSMCRYKASTGTKSDIHPEKIGEMIRLLKNVGKTVKVYGVRSKLVAKFKKSDDWVDLHEYAKRVLTDLVVNGNIETHLANVNHLNNFNNLNRYMELTKVFKAEEDDSLMGKFLIDLKEILKSKKKVEDPTYLNAIASEFGITLKKDCKYNLDASETAIFNQYPMFQLLLKNNRYMRLDRDLFKEVGNYINLVDKS